jgi:hypothetical protein
MDPLNLRIMIATGNPGRISREQMRQDLRSSALRLTRTDSRLREHRLQKRRARLRADRSGAARGDIKAGAVGLGEIMKDFGLTARKADGSRLKLDDPELDPIWSAAARLNIAVMMHVGDPAPFWDTFDYSNERYLEMALFPNRRCPPDRCPPFEELMGERDRLFKKHPKTKFVAAHFGWHATISDA